MITWGPNASAAFSERITSKIKGFPSWVRLGENTWALETDKDFRALWGYLSHGLASLEALVVARLSPPWATHTDPQVREWLETCRW